MVGKIMLKKTTPNWGPFNIVSDRNLVLLAQVWIKRDLSLRNLISQTLVCMRKRLSSVVQPVSTSCSSLTSSLHNKVRLAFSKEL